MALGFSAPFRKADGADKGIASLIGKIKFALEVLRIKWRAAQSKESRRVLFYDISALSETAPNWFRGDLIAVFDLLSRKQIEPQIPRGFKLDEAKDAHTMLEAGGIQGRLFLDLRHAQRVERRVGARDMRLPAL